MPKITKGGVSNQYVDPDFIAEPGVPVEKAVDEDLTDVGQEGVHIGDDPGHDQHKPDGQDVDRDRQADDEQPKGNDPAANDETRDDSDQDERKGNQLPSFDTPKKQTPAPARKTAPAVKK